MIPALKPIIETSYTDKGNEYKKSNVGKNVAGAVVTGAAAFYGGKAAFKGADKLYGKAKVIKLEMPKIEKIDFKKALTSAKDLKNKMPGLKAVKNSVTEIFKNAILLIEGAAKVVIDAAKKINMKNIKKAGESVVEFAKKPSVKKAAGIAAGIVAAGVAVDFIYNKISAKKADKA